MIGVNLYGTNVIHAWFNTGMFPATTFAEPPVVIGNGWSDGTRVQFADLTGDGRAELIGVSSTNNDGVMRVFPNTGAFPAWPWGGQVTVGTGWANPAWAKFADLTGDGRAEAIGVNINNNGQILADQNTGAFPNWPWGTRPSLGSGWTDPAKAKFGDLNGDGYAELIDVNLAGDTRAFARTQVGGYPAVPWVTTRTHVGSGIADPARNTYG